MPKKIDQQFILGGAQFEDDVSRTKALLDMVNTLVNKDKTIHELAEINDSNYFFVNEQI